MSLDNELTIALGKHSIWKGKIKAAITSGNVDEVESIVSDDYKCDFGKWLYSEGTVELFSEDGYYEEIKKLHKDIHEHVKKLLNMVKSGNKDKAIESFEGEMVDYFRRFTSVIMKECKNIEA